VETTQHRVVVGSGPYGVVMPSSPSTPSGVRPYNLPELDPPRPDP
jgi:hypothetical protein